MLDADDQMEMEALFDGTSSFHLGQSTESPAAILAHFYTRSPRSPYPPPPSSVLEMESSWNVASSDSSSAASPEVFEPMDWSSSTPPSSAPSSYSSPPASSPGTTFDCSTNAFQSSPSYDLSASPSYSSPSVSSGSIQLAAPETNPASNPDMNLILDIMLSEAKLTVGSEASDQAAKRRRRKDPEHRCKLPYCPRKFTEKHNLEKHMDVHNGVRQRCRCGQSFANKDTLRRHERKKHAG
ncbi:hypothetical protein VKT23_003470 [Stygiomarasmius scandens]|uniref:C2H2-type domain-containing protein n=1 Tax=Marasmiellus scandens TaxID=2682957 RepID=A0ABR1K045_9AGAR